MSKNEKLFIVILLIIIVVIVICGVFRKKEEPKEVNENVTENNVENVAQENEVDTNTLNENEVKNEIEEPIIENIIEVEPQGSVYESNSDIGTTDKKQQAINLVKEKWGDDDTVTFRCDSVNSKGEYVIAVVSKETASVKNYFKVNLNTKTVEIDY